MSFQQLTQGELVCCPGGSVAQSGRVGLIQVSLVERQMIEGSPEDFGSLRVLLLCVHHFGWLGEVLYKLCLKTHYRTCLLHDLSDLARFELLRHQSDCFCKVVRFPDNFARRR